MGDLLQQEIYYGVDASINVLKKLHYYLLRSGEEIKQMIAVVKILPNYLYLKWMQEDIALISFKKHGLNKILF